MTSEEMASQRRHRQRPRKGSAHSYDIEKTAAANNCGAHDRRVPNPIVAGLIFLLATILLLPIFDGVVRMTGVGFGVLAAPCMAGNA